MPHVLIALETATDVCGVALLREGRVEVELSLRRPRRHAAQLAPLVRDALRYGGLEPADLSAVAVSMGPGSYTGLRIGVSTAKGLCMATDAALVGVPTLEALAASVAPCAEAGHVLLPLLDARRDEVYAAAFRREARGAVEPIAETVACPVEALPEWLSGALPGAGRACWLAGSGATKAADALRGAGYDAHVLDPAMHPPSAAHVGHRALARLARGDAGEDVAAFEPFYLKDFVATPRRGTAFDRLP